MESYTKYPKGNHTVSYRNYLKKQKLKRTTKEEQEFYISFSNIVLQKQQSKICKMGSITPAEIKEIEELDRIEWQEDIVEDITEYIIEEKIKRRFYV